MNVVRVHADKNELPATNTKDVRGLLRLGVCKGPAQSDILERAGVPGGRHEVVGLGEIERDGPGDDDVLQPGLMNEPGLLPLAPGWGGVDYYRRRTRIAEDATVKITVFICATSKNIYWATYRSCVMSPGFVVGLPPRVEPSTS